MPHTKDDLIGELAGRLSDEPLAVLEELRGALIEPTRSVRRLDPALWGPAPDADEARGAAAANAVRVARERAEVAADALSREAIADLLGISAQAVSNRIRQDRLVAIREGRRWLLPVWQFDSALADPVLPGIPDALHAWPGSPVALSRWARTPSRDLDARTPAAALRDGDVREVVAAARALGAPADLGHRSDYSRASTQAWARPILEDLPSGTVAARGGTGMSHETTAAHDGATR